MHTPKTCLSCGRSKIRRSRSSFQKKPFKPLQDSTSFYWDDCVARVFTIEEGFSWTSNTSLLCTSESFLKCCLLPASIRKHMAISLRSPDKPVSPRMMFLKEPRLTFSTVAGTLTYFLGVCGLRRNIFTAWGFTHGFSDFYARVKHFTQSQTWFFQLATEIWRCQSQTN